jgi:hypothetical protein
MLRHPKQPVNDLALNQHNPTLSYVHIKIKNSAAVIGIKRLSSNGTGRLSTIAVKRASGRPIHPTNRQEGREKMINAKEPSTVLHRLYGRGWVPLMPRIVAAESPKERVKMTAAISLASLRERASRRVPNTNQNAPYPGNFTSFRSNVFSNHSIIGN